MVQGGDPRTALKPPCKIIENINTPIAPYHSPARESFMSPKPTMCAAPSGPAHPDDPQTSSVIHPGIDLSLFDKPIDEREAASMPWSMVYRLESDKLRPDAIQLFIEIVRRRPRTKVYIIGGGSFFPNLCGADQSCRRASEFPLHRLRCPMASLAGVVRKIRCVRG